MFRKTLLASAAAALAAAGALALTPASASAGGYSVYAGSGMSGSYAHVGSSGWSFGWGFPAYRLLPPPPPTHKVCKPVYKTVSVWQPYYGWVWKTVYAGEKCWVEPIYRAW